MVFRAPLRIYLALISAGLGTATRGMAVTTPRAEPPSFVYSIGSLKPALTLPLKDDTETIKMSADTMQRRLERATTDETVEPLTVLVGMSPTQVAAMAEKIAISGKEDDLARYLQRRLSDSHEASSLKGATAKTVIIDHQAFPLIDKDAFADLYAKPQHNLTIDGGELKHERTIRHELLHEIAPYFSKTERTVLQTKINHGETLSVNTDLLPEFARKMVKKFTIYRGPNCFHAALAFQSPLLTSSSLINVKRETGYHRAMINYDELWRVLSREFYEVNPEAQPLSYGDMLVLFDVPLTKAGHAQDPVDFRWIRHTATYLFDGYTFSKGSKSPNTPYSVRTVAEEWKTWKAYTKNLGMKVFRRSAQTIKPRPPMDLTDWVY